MARRAVCVGINAFKDPDAPALKGCVNDARNMAQMLVREFGYDPSQVRVLVDQQATKANYLQSLDWLVSSARPGDQLVLFTSSHGSHVPDQNGDEEDGFDEVLVTHDLDWDNTILIDDELAVHLARVPRGAVMACIWDTCHSGTMEDVNASAFRSRDMEAPVRHHTGRMAENVHIHRPRAYHPPAHKLRAMAAAARGAPPAGSTRVPDDVPCISLSACTDEQTAADAHFGGMDAGAFTHTLLEVVHSTTADLTWEDLLQKTAERVHAQGFNQTPQLHIPAALRGTPAFGGRTAPASAVAPGPAVASAGGQRMDTTALDQKIGALESQGNWQGALAALVERVNLVTDPAEKTRTLEHVVSVYRVKLHDEAGAVRATEALLAINPGHTGAQGYLRDAYTRAGDASKLQALNAHVAAHASGDRGMPGSMGSQISTALGTAAAAAGAAAAGVFHAVTSAPVAYAQPGVPQGGGVPVQSVGPTGAHPASPPRAPAAPSKPVCAYCGADLKPGDRVCATCGGEV